MENGMTDRQFLEHIKMQKAIYLVARSQVGGDDLFSYESIDGGLHFLSKDEMISKADQLCSEVYHFAEKRNQGTSGKIN